MSGTRSAVDRSLPDLDGRVREGAALVDLGNLDAAESVFLRILELAPEHAESHFKLANIRVRQGLPADAEAGFRRAIGADSRHHRAWYNLANLMRLQGRLAEAENGYLQVISLDPGYVNAYVNLGVTLEAAGRDADAEACFREALHRDPDDPETFANLGGVLRRLGRAGEAESACRESLRLDPRHAAGWNALGITLLELGRFEEAAAACGKAIELRADYPEAHNNLGTVLQAQGRLTDAERSYRAAIALRPGYPAARSNLGACLARQGRYAEAEALYREALALTPDDARVRNSLGGLLSLLGRPEEALACFRDALRLDPGLLAAHSNLLFALNYRGGNDPALVDDARRFGRAVTSAAQPYAAWTCPPSARPLRVGFVSPDLRNHPVGYFLESLLAQIDSGSVTLFAYPAKTGEDEVTHRLRRRFHAWRPIAGLSDEAAARLIHDDGIHVLIDLAGHTTDNRLSLFGWRPAPVQATWLGYFATTGVAEIDWLLATRIEVPESGRDRFTEAIRYLPDTRLCFTAPHADIPVGELPALRRGWLTFGCFQNLGKLGDSVLAAWARILGRLPLARLRLQCPQLGSDAERERLVRRLRDHGIDATRVSMHGAVAREAYLAAHAEVDLILDSFPYPGGTTTCEALWMGVPTVTLIGMTMIERQGASFLSVAGLPEWIASDVDEYVERAVAAAANLPALAALRSGLRGRVLASPLFDAPRFARAFEDALRGMWRDRHRREPDGNPT